jgi:hypothetical protein
LGHCGISTAKAEDRPEVIPADRKAIKTRKIAACLKESRRAGAV